MVLQLALCPTWEYDSSLKKLIYFSVFLFIGGKKKKRKILEVPTSYQILYELSKKRHETI